MKYSYQWTEDGEIEYGKVYGALTLIDINCYHCGKRISSYERIKIFCTQEGEEYSICHSCYEKSIKPCCKP